MYVLDAAATNACALYLIKHPDCELNKDKLRGRRYRLEDLADSIVDKCIKKR